MKKLPVSIHPQKNFHIKNRTTTSPQLTRNVKVEFTSEKHTRDHMFLPRTETNRIPKFCNQTGSAPDWVVAAWCTWFPKTLWVATHCSRAQSLCSGPCLDAREWGPHKGPWLSPTAVSAAQGQASASSLVAEPWKQIRADSCRQSRAHRRAKHADLFPARSVGLKNGLAASLRTHDQPGWKKQVVETRTLPPMPHEGSG